MSRKTLKLAVLATLLSQGSGFSATLGISGTNFSSLLDSTGATLAPGSIIQVGYFLGIDTGSTDPSQFGAIEWDTFSALTGPGSLNPSLTAGTEDINATFRGVYRLNLTIDDSSGGILPSFPSFMGVRIFDTTDPGSLDTADFNTVATTLASWTATGPEGTAQGPVLGLNVGGAGGNPSAFWQFSSNPFQTVPIPEPSSSVTLLLGTLLLLGKRRRS